MSRLMLEPSEFQLSSSHRHSSGNLYSPTMLNAMATHSNPLSSSSSIGHHHHHQHHHQHSSLSPYYQQLSAQHSLLGAYAYDVFQHHSLGHHSNHQGSPFQYGSTTNINSIRNVTKPAARCHHHHHHSSKLGMTIKNRQSVIQMTNQTASSASVSVTRPVNTSSMSASSVIKSKKILSGKDMERKRDLANKQERRRMHRLNDALNRLRQIIPGDTNSRRMSKIKTLQSAINYINGLQELLKH